MLRGRQALRKDDMAKKQSAPAQLVEKVRDTILFISPEDPSPLKDSHSLRWDCGMAEYQRKSLHVPFNREARLYAPEAYIRVADCAALATVGKAIALVAKAAGFTYQEEK
jgi:hypothetical protein